VIYIYIYIYIYMHIFSRSHTCTYTLFLVSGRDPQLFRVRNSKVGNINTDGRFQKLNKYLCYICEGYIRSLILTHI